MSAWHMYVAATVAWAAVAIGSAVNAASAAGRAEEGAAAAAGRAPAQPDFVIAVLADLLSDGMKTLALFNLGLAIVVGVFFGAVRACLGPLTLEDRRALKERLLSFSMFKMLLVAAVLDSIYETPWLLWAAWFAVIGLLNFLSYLGRKRLEAAMGNPALLAAAQNRYVALLTFVLCLDVLAAAAITTLVLGADAHLLVLLLSDCVIIALHAAHTLLRHWAVMREVAAGFAPDGRSDTVAYVDLVSDAASLAVTLLHYLHVWYLSGLSFSIIDFVLVMNVQAVVSSLRQCWRQWQTYRQLDRAIDSEFPNATPAQLAAAPDDTAAGLASSEAGDGTSGLQAGTSKECPICFEPMATAKVLPICGHVFHRGCLKRWLLGSHNTCPLCRQGLTPRIVAQMAAQQAAESERDARRRAAGAAAGGAGAALAAGTGAQAGAGARWGGEWLGAPFRMEAFGLGGGQGFVVRGGIGAGLGGGGGGGGGAAAGGAGGAPQATAPAPWFVAASASAAGAATQAALRNLVEMFPHLSPEALEQHLLHVARGDVTATVEAALAGDIPVAAPEEPPAPAPVVRAAGAATTAAASVDTAEPSSRTSDHALAAPAAAQASAERAVGGAGAAEAPGKTNAPLGSPQANDDADSDSEDIDADVRSLMQRAAAAGVQPDPFELLEARRGALVRRARRDYRRVQRAAAMRARRRTASSAAAVAPPVVAAPLPSDAAARPFSLDRTAAASEQSAAPSASTAPSIGAAHQAPTFREYSTGFAASAFPSDLASAGGAGASGAGMSVPAAPAPAASAASETPEQARLKRLAAIERRLGSGGAPAGGSGSTDSSAASGGVL